MAATTKLKRMTLDQALDTFIGKEGTPKRDDFDLELRIDLVGEMMKNTRKKRNLTQKELGELVGVQKAQISKLENGTGNATLTTILKVFNALQAKVSFRVELEEGVKTLT